MTNMSNAANKIDTNNFFANISVKASSRERKFAVDQAWRAFNRGRCHNPEVLKEILETEYTQIRAENGYCNISTQQDLVHFASIENSTRIFKLFKFITTENDK